MVTHANTLEIHASPAPTSQSSPINFGKTIVFNPHGMAYIISTGTIACSNPKSFKTSATVHGITSSLSAVTMYNFPFAKSFLNSNSDMVIPVKIILTGAIQAADFPRISSIVPGIFIPASPATHIFATYFGTSPQSYVINKRLTQAKTIIENGDYDNLYDVALAVGYEDALYFSRAFKKKYGMAPSGLVNE